MVKKITTIIDSGFSVSYLRDFALSSLLILTIFVFSFYSFFYGRNISKYGDIVLVVLLFLTLSRYCCSQPKKCSTVLVFLFWSFLAMTLSSVLFPPSIYADIGWFKKSLYRLMLAAGIVLSVSKVTSLDRKVVRWGGVILCLSLFTFSILVSYEIVEKNIFNNIFPFDVVRFAWNDKYYAFWFLFLMWSVVALLTDKGLLYKFFSVLVVVLAFWAIFLTTSESAQLAALASLLIFAIFHLPLGGYRYHLYLGTTAVILLVPVCWVMFGPVMPYVHEYACLGRIAEGALGLHVRIPLYDAGAQLIRENFFFGYGFGSSRALPVPQELYGGTSFFSEWNGLPGGHPHNIVFLFFLEHGFLGLLWFLSSSFLLFDYVFKVVPWEKGRAAICSMIISALIIFSLSFSMWEADVVAIYTMLFFMINIVAGGESVVSNDKLLANCTLKCIFFVSFVSVMAGFIRYFNVL